MTVKLVEGKLQYLLDVGAGILVVILYGLSILFVNDAFPKASNILNLFITFICVDIALPFIIGLLTPVIQIFNNGFTFNGNIVLSQNHMLNLFLKYMTLRIIALPI